VRGEGQRPFVARLPARIPVIAHARTEASRSKDAFPPPSSLLTPFIVIALLLASCAALPPNTEPVDRLLVLMQERLRLADDVAKMKWNTGAPIEDLARENAVVEQAAIDAPRYGVSPDFARNFFRAQIEASKIVQRARFTEWQANNQPKFARVADLQADIRPALDALTPKLLDALARALPVITNTGQIQLESRSAAAMTGVIESARDVAALPLKQLSTEEKH
jgi:chorismate mutase